ncbi:MAG: helix-turn-helix domain-containing protein [Actinomycetaceae bacterium]
MAGTGRGGGGILYPGRLPRFRRVAAPTEIAHLVRWFWLPRWDLSDGVTSRQSVLAFPASNLVVEAGGVSVVGPTTRISHRDLTGRGWAVGMLLRPAGLAALVPDPGALRDAERALDAPELHGAVVAAVAEEERRAEEELVAEGNRQAEDGHGSIHMRDAENRRGADEPAVVPTAPPVRTPPPVAAATRWWRSGGEADLDDGARLANAMERAVADDASIVRIEDIAGRLGVSVRTVQRLARRYVGLPPLTIIRRYRLQEAAERLRVDPGWTIARVAADLGYADHAHLTADFTATLGVSPSEYRASVDDK